MIVLQRVLTDCSNDKTEEGSYPRLQFVMVTKGKKQWKSTVGKNFDKTRAFVQDPLPEHPPTHTSHPSKFVFTMFSFYGSKFNDSAVLLV